MSKADLESIMRDFKNLNSRVNNDNKKLKEELKKRYVTCILSKRISKSIL